MGNVSCYLHEMGIVQSLSLTKFLRHTTHNNTRYRFSRSLITTLYPSRTRAVRPLPHRVQRHQYLRLGFLHYPHRYSPRLLGSSEEQSRHHLCSRPHRVLTTKTWGSEVQSVRITPRYPTSLQLPLPAKRLKRRDRRRRGELC